MGRELRRVPAGWWPPIQVNRRYIKGKLDYVEEWQPQRDEDFETAATDWLNELKQWMDPDAHPDYCDRGQSDRTIRGFVNWNGPMPDPGYYRPAWSDEERTHYQVYETVTEGTPLSPAFATKQEVVEWWTTVGDWTGTLTRDQAERWVEVGFSTSMVVTSTGVEWGHRHGT